MQNGPLPTGVKADCMPYRIEKTHESRDEAVIGKILGKLVVDVPISLVQAGPATKRHAQHGLHLGCGQCRTKTMPRGISHQDEQLIFKHHQVEQVAPGMTGGDKMTVQIITGHTGHHGRQGAHLDFPRQRDFLVQPLFQYQRFGQLHPLDGDGTLRSERGCQEFITFIENAHILVQQLQHADRLLFQAQQWNIQNRLRLVACHLVHRPAKSRICVGVGDVDDFAIRKALTHETFACSHSGCRLERRDFHDQIVPGCVVQP